ncbi:MAG: preprotein translocase subunit YajC [Alphaproteobacteria bacterium]
MLISPAFAQTGASGDGMGFATFVPLILIFVVFYFLLIRPQQKKMKEHREMVKALRRGDKIVTAGGIIGTISKVPEGDEVEVEVSRGTTVRVVRSTIQQVMSKPEPADSDEKSAEK